MGRWRLERGLATLVGIAALCLGFLGSLVVIIASGTGVPAVIPYGIGQTIQLVLISTAKDSIEDEMHKVAHGR